MVDGRPTSEQIEAVSQAIQTCYGVLCEIGRPDPVGIDDAPAGFVVRDARSGLSFLAVVQTISLDAPIELFRALLQLRIVHHVVDVPAEYGDAASEFMRANDGTGFVRYALRSSNCLCLEYGAPTVGVSATSLEGPLSELAAASSSVRSHMARTFGLSDFVDLPHG